MLESIYTLVALHILSTVWFLIVFIPANRICWGWLWILQIVVTEWISIAVLVFAFLAIYDFSFIIYFLPLLYYLFTRKSTVYISGTNTSDSRNDATEVRSWIYKVWHFVWPFKFNPKAKTWSEHLKFETSHPQRICIHIHGGAWKHGDASQLTSIAGLLNKKNIEVISINYKKYPELTLSQVILEVEKTFKSILNHYGDKQIILYGRSAGGHLALRLAEKWPQQIQKVIALYPVTDLENLYLESDNKDVLKTHTWMQQVIGKDLKDGLDLYRELSPIHLLGTDMPPVLLVHGENDPVVNIKQSQRFFAALKKRNLDCVFLQFKYGTHGFDAVWNGPSMNRFKSVLVRFLD